MALRHTATFMRLPSEILLIIRTHIHSLAGHVHFSNTTRATRNVYDDDDFWRNACIAAGFGMPKDCKVDTWRSIAAIVVHDGTKSEFAPPLATGLFIGDDKLCDPTMMDLIYEPFKDLAFYSWDPDTDKIIYSRWGHWRATSAARKVVISGHSFLPISKLHSPSMVFRCPLQLRVLDTVHCAFDTSDENRVCNFTAYNPVGLCIYDILKPMREDYIASLRLFHKSRSYHCDCMLPDVLLCIYYDDYRSEVCIELDLAAADEASEPGPADSRWS